MWSEKWGPFCLSLSLFSWVHCSLTKKVAVVLPVLKCLNWWMWRVHKYMYVYIKNLKWHIAQIAFDECVCVIVKIILCNETGILCWNKKHVDSRNLRIWFNKLTVHTKKYIHANLVPCLLKLWFLVSPGHQHPQCWTQSFCSKREIFNCLLCKVVELWYVRKMYLCFLRTIQHAKSSYRWLSARLQ